MPLLIGNPLPILTAALLCRAESATEGIRREHTSRMTVERAKALKLKMELENLEKDFKRKVSI